MKQAITAILLVVSLPLTACGAKDIEPTVEGDVLRFEAPDLEGKVVTDSEERFEGKVVLVDIWGSWCPPCRKSIPKLAEMQKELGEAGLVVVGVAFEEESDTDARRAGIRKAVEDLGINYLVLDGGTTSNVEKVFPTLEGFRGFPTMIIVGRDGNVAHANTVFVPREEKEIRREVEKALEIER